MSPLISKFQTPYSRFSFNILYTLRLWLLATSYSCDCRKIHRLLNSSDSLSYFWLAPLSKAQNQSRIVLECVLLSRGEFLREKPWSKIAVIRDVRTRPPPSPSPPRLVALSHPPSRRRFRPLPSRHARPPLGGGAPRLRRTSTPRAAGRIEREKSRLSTSRRRAASLSSSHRMIFAQDHRDFFFSREARVLFATVTLLLIAPVNSDLVIGDNE